MATRKSTLNQNLLGACQPNGIRSCYDEGKRCAETLFFDYRRQHKLRIKVARIFNTYGPQNAPKRRPGGLEFHCPGPAERADHNLWRWLSKAGPSVMSMT